MYTAKKQFREVKPWSELRTNIDVLLKNAEEQSVDNNEDLSSPPQLNSNHSPDTNTDNLSEHSQDDEEVEADVDGDAGSVDEDSTIEGLQCPTKASNDRARKMLTMKQAKKGRSSNGMSKRSLSRKNEQLSRPYISYLQI